MRLFIRKDQKSYGNGFRSSIYNYGQRKVQHVPEQRPNNGEPVKPYSTVAAKKQSNGSKASGSTKRKAASK